VGTSCATAPGGTVGNKINIKLKNMIFFAQQILNY
jgi:hypothetical protein